MGEYAPLVPARVPPLRRRLPPTADDDTGDAAAGDAAAADEAHCFDCASPLGREPPWVSVSYGVTLCLNCAGVHRSFGVHVS